MLPKPPPREGGLGFLYLPPFRVQGTSVAGEATCVQVPELDVCFDAGSCPRPILAAKYLAVSHGHMDHIGSLAYWCSQRRFQGMGTGKIVCDKRIETAVHNMMKGFIELERQETEYEVIALEHEQQIEIKNNILLRCFHTEHAGPSVGYAVLERRTKLKDEFQGMPQEKLKELKDRNIEITRSFEIPLVAYIGDTMPGPHLVRTDVRTAQIVISECTFFEGDHQDRAKIGQHMHVADVAEWLRVLECNHLVLCHVSRRTNLMVARQEIEKRVPPEKAAKVHFLMDHRANKFRYEKQCIDAGVPIETRRPPPRSGGPGRGGHGHHSGHHSGDRGGYRGGPPRH